MKIAYVTISDPADPHAWSGINYVIARALAAQGMEVIPIGPLTSKRTFWGKVLSFLSRWMPGGRYLWSLDHALLRAYARQAEQLLAECSCDLIFSPGSQVIAFLKTKLPIVFWTDAPFAAMRDYYGWYTRVSDRSYRDGQEIDDRALRRSNFACYSSRWAADAAIRGHGGNPARVKVLPFGANLPGDVAEEDVPALVRQRLGAPWRLLFVGVEWKRKGGDLVLATARLLHARGYPVELILVGCEPPVSAGPLPDWVRREGFVSQHTPEGQQRLADLYRSSLFFFMPSQAEAYGIVFCEANSFAVPCLSKATGGVTSIIENGSNGWVFPLNAPAEAYADFIIQTASVAAHYERLAIGALRAFRERLNWETSVAGLIGIFQTAVREDRLAIEDAAAPADTQSPALEDAMSPLVDRPLRLAFVADDYVDPTRVGAWSGLPHYVWRAFQKHNVQVRLILVQSKWHKALCWVKFCAIKFLTGKRYLRDRDPALLRSYARQIESALDTETCDFVFSPASTPLALVDTRVPMAFWVDASFAGMNDFYASFSRLHGGSVREGYAADQATLDRAALSIYSSDWAAETVRRGYRIDPKRLHVVRFGANLTNVPTTAEIDGVIRQRERGVCRLLLIGVDWKRKGVDLAVSTLSELERLGIPARLTIIGCEPPSATVLPPNVEVLGFVSKTTQEGRDLIERHLRESHFFFLPSRAEAYGLVFCEASAFGLPCIATDVGGVGAIVENGVNGWLLAPEAPPSAYAERIQATWQNPDSYERTARNGRRLYDERLNWETATAEVVDLMRRWLREHATAHASGL